MQTFEKKKCLRKVAYFKCLPVFSCLAKKCNDFFMFMGKLDVSNIWILQTSLAFYTFSSSFTFSKFVVFVRIFANFFRVCQNLSKKCKLLQNLALDIANLPYVPVGIKETKKKKLLSVLIFSGSASSAMSFG